MVTKMMKITYPVHTGLYLNLTNRCPCACNFCIRQKDEKFYVGDSLWLDHEPDSEEVIEALKAEDLDKYNEFVFCGFGEPTEALDLLLQTAKFLKDKKPDTPVRINTNGLGNLINKKDITPLFEGIIDAVSISLNSSYAEVYEKNVNPIFKEKAHPAVIDFAREVKKYVPNVTMTIVSTTITHEDEEKCRNMCEQLGVKYKIRQIID